MRPINIAGTTAAARTAGTASTPAPAPAPATGGAPIEAGAPAKKSLPAGGKKDQKPPPPPPPPPVNPAEPAEQLGPVRPQRTETVEDLRTQQRAVREANPVPEFLARQNQPGRTFAQAAMDVARAPLFGSMIEDAVGRDRYSKAKAAVSEYVPDIARTAASYVPPILSGPLGGTLPGAAVAFAAGGNPEKRNIAGREVVVYPRFAELRADDRGPARDVRLAREAPTPAQFGARRDALRKAFETAKKGYDDATKSAQLMARESTRTGREIEDAALAARTRLQKVVDLREALRELQEPEDKLSID